MRILDPLFDAESAGTTSGDYLEVSLWRDGKLLASSLDIGQWGIEWDADRPIQGQGSIEIIDQSGELIPYALSDPLGAGGSRLFITWVSGMTATRVPLGWWRIRESEPEEDWQYVEIDRDAGSAFGEGLYGMGLYGGGEPRVEVLTVVTGHSIVVDIDEETSTVYMERLDAEAAEKPTCLGEVKRLLQNICAVSIHPDVVDRPIPRGLIYDSTPEGSRLSAVLDHVQRCFATYRMGGDGTFEVIPEAGVKVDWPIRAGGEGVLAAFKRKISDETVYNAVVSTASTADGRQLVGRAFVQNGELRWGGPYGRVPMFHFSPATSQEGVESDAATLLRNRQMWRDQVIAATVVTHPGVQINDVVPYQMLTTAGPFEIDARVSRMALRAAGGTPSKSMDLDLVIPSDFLVMVADRVRKANRGR